MFQTFQFYLNKFLHFSLNKKEKEICHHQQKLFYVCLYPVGLYIMGDSLQGSDFCDLYSHDFSLCGEITKNVTYLMNLYIFYKLIKQK